MKILIVDDDINMQGLLETVCQMRKHTTKACSSGTEAFEEYNKEHYDLILLDWVMPGMDGLELCRKIRSLPDGDKSIIMMVTAKDSPESMNTVLNAGADDYLVKPLTVSILNIRLTVAEQKVIELNRRKEAESKVNELHAKIRERHDDMLSILKELQIGAIIVESDKSIAFINQTAQNLIGTTHDIAVGKEWTTLLPLKSRDIKQIEMEQSLPTEKRCRSPYHITNSNKTNYWIELDIRNDPMNPERRIFFFYDVTEIYDLRNQLIENPEFHGIIGKSKSITELKSRIYDFARLNWTVLIEGETGTGKELVARAIHNTSDRRDNPFIAVNTAGLSESLLESQLFGHTRGAFTGAVSDQKGLFETADKGTLFLDEIGDISPKVQVSLLRVLEEKKITRLGDQKEIAVDVKVITATNRDLNREVAEEKFRKDLLYRIRSARISIPPLREHNEDIPMLFKHFLSKSIEDTGKNVVEIKNDSMQLLINHCWPGNVRELKSAVDYAVIHCKESVITTDNLPPEIVNPETVPTPITNNNSKELDIHEALKQAGGNRSEAAKLMGISRATFYRKLTSS